MSSKRQTYLCDKCGACFKRSHDVKRHKNDTCGKTASICCEEPGCTKVFKTKRALGDHLGRRHGKGDQIRCLPCHICPMTFNDYAGRNYHEKTRHGCVPNKKDRAAGVCSCRSAKANGTPNSDASASAAAISPITPTSATPQQQGQKLSLPTPPLEIGTDTVQSKFLAPMATEQSNNWENFAPTTSFAGLYYDPEAEFFTNEQQQFALPEFELVPSYITADQQPMEQATAPQFLDQEFFWLEKVERNLPFAGITPQQQQQQQSFAALFTYPDLPSFGQQSGPYNFAEECYTLEKTEEMLLLNVNLSNNGQ